MRQGGQGRYHCEKDIHKQPGGGKKACHTNFADLWEERYQEQTKDADTSGRNMCGMLAQPEESQ